MALYWWDWHLNEQFFVLIKIWNGDIFSTDSGRVKMNLQMNKTISEQTAFNQKEWERTRCPVCTSHVSFAYEESQLWENDWNEAPKLDITVKSYKMWKLGKKLEGSWGGICLTIF